jgi:FMN phosphatase YigB (HAD superfamily)
MIKIYCDLDGVLTDFDKTVKRLGRKAAEGLNENATEEQKNIMYKAIDLAGRDFWSDMEWLEDGRKLWDKIKKYHPVLLSSPGEFRYAPAGKQDWVNKNLPGVTLYIESLKYKYAERDAILIDDMEKNISMWKEAGGLGIIYKDSETAVEELRQLIKMNKISNKVFISNLLRELSSKIIKKE